MMTKETMEKREKTRQRRVRAVDALAAYMGGDDYGDDPGLYLHTADMELRRIEAGPTEGETTNVVNDDNDNERGQSGWIKCRVANPSYNGFIPERADNPREVNQFIRASRVQSVFFNYSHNWYEGQTAVIVDGMRYYVLDSVEYVLQEVDRIVGVK